MDEKKLRYREFMPRKKELRSLVDCFWSFSDTDPDPARQHRICPDGCVDILFEFRDSGFDSRVIGAMTHPVLKNYSEPIQVFGIRFAPGAASMFLDLPINLLNDECVELESFWPDSKSIDDQLNSVSETNRRIAIVENCLSQKLKASSPQWTVAHDVVKAVTANPIQCNVAALSKSYGLSRQHLTRLVKATCGLGPKQLARIMRLQMLFEHLKSKPNVNWSLLAADFGFFDQSHLIREFRELVGTTPDDYLNTQR